MSTQESIVEFLVSQVAGAGAIRARKMFGEYALYCDEKIVALICDDKFFLKPTNAGKAFAKNAEEAPPYPGSRPFLVIDEDHWDNAEWMSELVRVSAAELPLPKPKKKKVKSAKSSKSR